MKKTPWNSRAMVRGLVILSFAFVIVAHSSAWAQIIGVRSAVVQPGDTIAIAMEISADVLGVYGFQLDLEVTPSAGAPELSIQAIAKGAAVTTATDVDSNPALPTTGSVRIGLPTEIPPQEAPRPSFDGPGAIVDVQFLIPAGAAPGQSYQLSLTNVLLAGPGNQAVPLTILGGTLTVGNPGGTTAPADTIQIAGTLALSEGEVSPLTLAVTGAGQPVPGVELLFSVDDPEIASISSTNAVTGAGGTATVDVTALRHGSTTVRVSAPGLGRSSVTVSVSGFSPLITTTPPLEVAEGADYTYDVDATDPNGGILTYSLLAAPAGMTIDSSTGLIEWTNASRPSETEKAVDVTVEVRDPDDHTDAQSFSVFITVDADGDGFDDRVDCDDDNPDVNPGVGETIENGIDDDCNPDTSDAPPIANFDFEPSIGAVGEEIQFSDISTARVGTIVAWQWDFGDGVISNLQNPTHTYYLSGNFTVTLTVTDDSGGANTTAKSIRVSAAPRAAFSIAKGMNVAQLEYGAAIVEASQGTWPERAIDGASGVWNISDTTVSQWIKVELAGGKSYIIDRVKLPGFSPSIDYYVKDFEIKVSNTGTEDGDFNTVFTGTVPQEERLHEFTFPAVEARFVQLVVLNNWGRPSYTYVDNFQVWSRDREGGVLSMLDGPPPSIVDASSWSSVPQNILDEDSNTGWSTPGGAIADEWVKVELGGGKTYTINSIRLQALYTNYGANVFEIRVSTTTTEDSAFTTVFTGTAANSTELQEFFFDPVEAKFVQLFIQSNHGGSYIGMSTFQVLTIDGANAARLGGVGAFAVDYSSRYSSSFGPEKAIDFSPSSMWRSAQGEDTDQWIKILLIDGGPHLVDRFLLQGGLTYGPKDFVIRVSTASYDDADFVTVLNGTLPDDGLPHWLTIEPVEAKYVQLLVKDNHWDPSLGSSYIQVSDFKVYSSGLGGPVVPFNDLSMDPDGDIESWQWIFGDGNTSSDRYPVHTYSAPGTYTVSLTVTDSDGLLRTVTKDYTVLAPPEVDFDWSPVPAEEGRRTDFTGIGTDADGKIVDWQWLFSHTSNPESGQSSGARFPDNGEYTVILTITDSQLLTASVTKVVTVINLPPVISTGPDESKVWGEEYHFNASVSDPAQYGDDLSCEWDFGDGETAYLADCTGVGNPHVYARPGQYDATLTVTDKDGASTSETVVANVIKRDSLLNVIEGIDPADSGQVSVAAKLFDYYTLTNWSYIDPYTEWITTVSGRTVTFKLGDQIMATAITDENGIARTALNVTADNQERLTAEFVGDDFFNPYEDEDIPLSTGDVLATIGNGKIKHFGPDGNLIQVLTSYNPRNMRSPENTGMCFDSVGDMYATNFDMKTVCKYSSRGGLLAYPWGIRPLPEHCNFLYDPIECTNSYFWKFPESCVADAADNIYTGEVDGSNFLRKFDTAGNIIRSFTPERERRGIDWIDLAADQCTMFYTSEGHAIKRYDVCDDVQLDDFATGLEGECFALRIRENGEVMVACEEQVYRLDSLGNSIQTYYRTTYGPMAHYNDTFFALNLDPDGTSFWTATYYPGDIYRIDIETGGMLIEIEAEVEVTLAGLAVVGEPTVARNQSPVADAGADAVAEVGTDVTLDGTASSDPNPGQSLTFAWTQLSGPDVVLSAADTTTPTFTPTEPGTYTFELTVSDGRLSDTDTVTITVEGGPVNQPPVADDQAVPADEDTHVVITLTGSDADNDPLTFEVVSQPSHGSLSGTAPNLTYSPDADFNGPDSFTFTVNDGQSDSSPATVSITVNPVNDPPTLAPIDDQVMDEGTTLTLTLSSTDPDGDSITLTMEGLPPFGTFTDNGNGTGSIEFTSGFDDAGVYENITVTASDGTLSGEDEFTLTVNSVNRPPLADDVAVSTEQDTPVDITLTGSDPDGDALSFSAISQPSHGTLSGTAPNLTYAPDTGYSGPDSFTFKANDGEADSNIATVSITVNPAEQQPIIDLMARAKSGKIDLVWSPVAVAASYNVYRSTTSGGPYELIAAGHVTDYCVYADFGLTNGVKYYYVVQWVDAAGQASPASNEASATPTARVRR